MLKECGSVKTGSLFKERRSFAGEEEFEGGGFDGFAPAEFGGVEFGFVGELAVGDEKELATATQRLGGGVDEGAAEVEVGGLPGVEGWIHDDDVIAAVDCVSQVMPVAGDGDLRVWGKILAGAAEGAGIGFVEVELSDVRALGEQPIGEKAPAGTEVGGDS